MQLCKLKHLGSFLGVISNETPSLLPMYVILGGPMIIPSDRRKANDNIRRVCFFHKAVD
jgi:hypothetical protein